MNTYASASYSLATAMPEIDRLAKFRAVLEPYSDLPLVFNYAGRDIAAGYHLTEVKTANLSSLDCGANPESWTETIIQLWDIEKEGATHMTAGKFLGILNQVGQRMVIDADGLLVFEAGDSIAPMQVFTVGAVKPRDTHIEVRLTARPATCKPRQRGLVDTARAAACCAPAKTAGKACCS